MMHNSTRGVWWCAVLVDYYRIVMMSIPLIDVFCVVFFLLLAGCNVASGQSDSYFALL